jgi:hypothetical protein
MTAKGSIYKKRLATHDIPKKVTRTTGLKVLRGVSTERNVEIQRLFSSAYAKSIAHVVD